jgi:hypothetical protein
MKKNETDLVRTYGKIRNTYTILLGKPQRILKIGLLCVKRRTVFNSFRIGQNYGFSCRR